MTINYLIRRVVSTAAKALVAVAPIQIVETRKKNLGTKHQFTLNEAKLKEVVENEDTKNLPVVVISIAGDFRKGKSFMLNFFVRYLQAKSNGEKYWLGDSNNNNNGDDQPLKGFSWKSGSDGHTNGVLIWPEVFKVKNKANQEVGVILMDTQGTFDTQRSDKECATVFALSTMLSSVQIFNLKENIQKNDLQYLQLFVSYGMQALEKYTDKPFQTLYFLIRDWSSPHEYSYGKKGGQMLIEKRLEPTSGEDTEQFRLTKNIRKCFKTISCFLMPHPGKIVATSADFNGSLSDIDPEFLEHALNFVEDVLSPENLVTKSINGNQVHVKDLPNYFQAYLKVFNGNELPKIQSIAIANAEANLSCAVGNAEDYYKMQMADVFTQLKLNMESLQVKHEDAKGKAIAQFLSSKCLDDKKLRQKFKIDLVKKIDDLLPGYESKLEIESLKQHKAALTEATDLYDQHMEAKFPLSRPYVDVNEFFSEHEKARNRAIQEYSSAAKWDEEKHSRNFHQRLLKKLEALCSKHKRINDDKWRYPDLVKQCGYFIYREAVKVTQHRTTQIMGLLAVSYLLPQLGVPAFGLYGIYQCMVYFEAADKYDSLVIAILNLKSRMERFFT